MGAKDAMQYGDKIYLPNTVQELSFEKTENTEKIEYRYNEEEQKFVQSLELYKVLVYFTYLESFLLFFCPIFNRAYLFFFFFF